MPRYCQNPPLGTTRDAKIRIRIQLRTPYAPAPCGSVAKIARKDVEKGDHATLGASDRFFAYFGPSAVLPSSNEIRHKQKTACFFDRSGFVIMILFRLDCMDPRAAKKAFRFDSSKTPSERTLLHKSRPNGWLK